MADTAVALAAANTQLVAHNIVNRLMTVTFSDNFLKMTEKVIDLI